MKPPFEMVALAAYGALAVSGLKWQILTFNHDPAAAWWVLVQVALLLMLTFMRLRWYQDPRDDARVAVESASPSEQIGAGVRIMWIAGLGFALAGAASGFVFVVTLSELALGLALGSLVVGGTLRWWLPKFATWSHGELEFVGALATMYWVMIVVSAVVFPWWGAHE